MSSSSARAISTAATHRESDAGRWFLIPFIGLGLVGAVVGFGIGLVTYWRTAPFAAFEVGIPAAGLGALIGLVGMAARSAHLRRTARRHSS